MEPIATILSCITQVEQLKKTGGISFTLREVDVISCLINGRNIKRIAILLSISPKTVEVHVRNIMLKIDCSTNDKIIDFVELWRQQSMFSLHYRIISEKHHFNRMLQQRVDGLSSLHNKFIQIVVMDHKCDQLNGLITSMQEALEVVKIKTSKILFASYAPSTLQVIYIVTNESESETLQGYLKKNSDNSNYVIMFFNTTPSSDWDKLQHRCLAIDNRSAFYLMICEILYLLNPLSSILQIKQALIDQMHSLTDTTDFAFNEVSAHSNLSPILKPVSSPILGFSKFSLKTRVLFMTLVLLPISLFGMQHYSNKQEIAKKIRHDLLLPSKATLLKRANILENIDKIFNKDTNKIKQVVLLGIGGAGKTTLARDYALGKNNAILWEINAENEMEVIKSLERFIINISSDKHVKQEIAEMYKFNNIEHLKTKLLSMTQKCLKNNPNWLLIYDNIDNINDIIQYLPHNADSWGAGNVLLLTRNQNIDSNKYVDRKNIIHVAELTPEEKKSLFLSIYRPEQVAVVKQKSDDNMDLEKFLHNLPPFPLDVTTAAYFLKNTSTDYNAYLQDINNYSASFIDLHSEILNDADNNFKTRYNIVVNVIQNIISHDTAFKNKLLTIGLLDPSSIPLELLGEENNGALLLTRELSRYSLVNYNDSIASNSLALHRSVHHIIYLSLKDHLLSKAGAEHMQQISNKIASKLSSALHTEQISEIKSMAAQGGEFIKKAIQNPDINVSDLQFQIGRAYRYLGKFNEAIAMLRSIKDFASNIDIVLELGGAYKNVGQYTKSIDLLEHNLSLARKNYGLHSIQFARLAIRLDVPYQKFKRYAEAIDLLEQALIAYQSKNDTDPGDIAFIYTKLGHLYTRLGNINKGIELFNKSLDIQTKLYGKNHIRTAWTYVRMAGAYKDLKQYDLAQQMLKDSFAVYQSHYGKNHTKTAWVLGYLGMVEGLRGNFKLAEKHINDTLAIQRQFYSDRSVRLAWALNLMADLYERNNMPAKASHYFTLAKNAVDETD